MHSRMLLPQRLRPAGLAALALLGPLGLDATPAVAWTKKQIARQERYLACTAHVQRDPPSDLDPPLPARVSCALLLKRPSGRCRCRSGATERRRRGAAPNTWRAPVDVATWRYGPAMRMMPNSSAP